MTPPSGNSGHDTNVIEKPFVFWGYDTDVIAKTLILRITATWMS